MLRMRLGHDLDEHVFKATILYHADIDRDMTYLYTHPVGMYAVETPAGELTEKDIRKAYPNIEIIEDKR